MIEWKMHAANPQTRAVKSVVEELRKGAIMIYPTDTLYGLGCDMFQSKAVERICRIKQIDPLKVNLSLVCADLSELSLYAKSIDTPLYRILKHYLPGPYTFILPASKQVPKILKTRKHTIGLRIPDHAITRAIIQELGHPLLSTSVPGTSPEEIADPENIRERLGKQVDIFVNAGTGGIVPSTIINATTQDPELVRQGLGEWK